MRVQMYGYIGLRYQNTGDLWLIKLYYSSIERLPKKFEIRINYMEDNETCVVEKKTRYSLQYAYRLTCIVKV